MTTTTSKEEEWFGPPPSPRPWWLDPNKILDDKTSRVRLIEDLTEEEFKEHQKSGMIPPEYKISDWIK